MKKILLFDADGTLFDFHAAEKEALDHLLDVCRIENRDAALKTYHEINHAMWKKVESGMMTQSQLKLKRFEEFKDQMQLDLAAKTMAEVFMEKLSQGTQLIDYAFETLEILYKEYDCYIITNGITSIQKGRMSSSVLKPFFKELFISEEMGVSKPDPRYFDKVKEKLSPSHDDMLIVIGDSLSSDIKGAIQSHLKCIWYNPHHQENPGLNIDAVIDDLRTLPHIIQTL